MQKCSHFSMALLLILHAENAATEMKRSGIEVRFSLRMLFMRYLLSVNSRICFATVFRMFV